jgi:hypothetical protein
MSLSGSGDWTASFSTVPSARVSLPLLLVSWIVDSCRGLPVQHCRGRAIPQTPIVLRATEIILLSTPYLDPPRQRGLRESMMKLSR